MSAGAVAERYAQALFELGVETSTLGPLAEKLRAFAEVYANDKAFRSVLSNPLVPAEERKAVLRAVAQRLSVPEVGLKGLLVMADRRRLSAVPATAERLTQLADDEQGVVRASVVTAKQMPEAFYQNLSTKLASATGRKVALQRRVEPSLIGGAITRVGDATVDGSVKGHLETIEKRLLAALSESTPRGESATAGA